VRKTEQWSRRSGAQEERRDSVSPDDYSTAVHCSTVLLFRFFVAVLWPTQRASG
jgi:hypothetical protein